MTIFQWKHDKPPGFLGARKDGWRIHDMSFTMPKRRAFSYTRSAADLAGNHLYIYLEYVSESQELQLKELAK